MNGPAKTGSPSRTGESKITFQGLSIKRNPASWNILQSGNMLQVQISTKHNFQIEFLAYISPLVALWCKLSVCWRHPQTLSLPLLCKKYTRLPERRQEMELNMMKSSRQLHSLVNASISGFRLHNMNGAPQVH